MLDQDTSLLELAVPLGVWPEQLEILNRCWVHRRNIQQGHVLIASRLGADVSALADLLAAVCRLAVLVLVAGEHLRQVCVLQVLLSVPLTLEYDLSGQLVGAGVDRETCDRSEDLTCLPVRLQMVPYLLCGDDVVVAICGDLFPHLLRHRFVPGKTELLVVDTQFDLPLLEGLLLGGEVVDIGVGQVVGLSESLLDKIVDDLTREVIELNVRVAQDTTVEDMVVVPTVVESYELPLHKIRDLVRSRVDHPLDLVGSPNFPVHKEQVREYLDVVNDGRTVIRLLIGLLMVAPRGERHLLH